MKVFISSVITGFEPYRDAAARAAGTLRHQVIRAEQFSAAPDSPQRVCLSGVREADVVLLLLGQRYGEIQSGSGLSPTHEEFREARERCPVLVFVQNGVKPEPAQTKFLREVQDWAAGHYTARFSTSEDLRDAVVSALHDIELAQKAGDVNERDLLAQAQGCLPSERRSGSASVSLVIVGAPRQQVIRPAGIESAELAKTIMQEAIFGANAVLASSFGSSPHVKGGQLVIEQDNASVMVDQLGTVCVVQPVHDREEERQSMLPALVEEEIAERIERALRFSSWLLDLIDPSGRLTQVVPVAGLTGAGYMGWMTRAERAKRPNSMQMGRGSDDGLVASLSPASRPRAALRVNAATIAEDLMVLLRRQVRQ